LIKNDDAIQSYTQLLDQFGSSSFANVARYEKALTYYKMGKYREAVADAEKVNQTPDMKKDVSWLLAESHAALNEEDLAIQYYRIITTEFAKSDVACDAAYRLAHHLQGKKEYKEAARCYNIVAADFPDNKLAPRALYASGVCNAMDNRHEEALRDWAGLIQKYPDDPLVEDSLYQKAMSEIRLKRFADATASRQSAGRVRPDSDGTIHSIRRAPLMNTYQLWTAFYTMMRKDVVRIFRIWVQTFLPSVITSCLYFLIFGTVLGSRIGTMIT